MKNHKKQEIPIQFTIKKVCYICQNEIRTTQRFYAIGKDKKGNELYRHLKCKASDYKGV